MENIFVMSHASDIDGVGSAALIQMKYKLPSSRLFFSDYSKEGLAYVDKNLGKFYKTGITLFIADLGVNPKIEPSYLQILKKVKKYGGKVCWFDHHPWSDSAIKKLASKCDVAIIGENKDYCATEITYRELGFTDDFTKNFARIVHLSDFNIKPRSEEDYNLVGIYAISIASYYSTNQSWDYITKKLRYIADIISKGKFTDPIIAADAYEFNKINEERVMAMLKQLEIRDNVAVGFSRHVQSTYACGAITQETKKRIVIYVNVENSRGHIRSTGPDISVLARALGGGGHPKASGFDIDPKKFGGFRTRENKAKFADFIQEKIKKLGIR